MAPIELVAPVSGEHHHPAVGHPPRDVVEQVARRAVGPVDVVEDQEQPALASPQIEQGDNRLEHPELCLGGIPGGRGLSTVSELREELRKLPAHGAELGSHWARSCSPS
jgi:hypothetical protein